MWLYERLVLDFGLWLWLEVLVLIMLVDDLVVNHVGKVLKTVELDLIVVVVNYMGVVAAASSAR